MLARQSPVISVEAEVIGNINSQAIGGHTVADLHLSDGFLRRVADRVIRESFEERFRIVVAEGGRGGSDPGPATPTRLLPAGVNLPFAVVRAPVDPATRAYREGLVEGRVECRGFRAPILGDERRPSTSVARNTEAQARAADHVAKRLAVDGLLATTAAAIGILGVQRFLEPANAELDQLEAVGLPVDLLRFFRLGQGEGSRGVIKALAEMARDSTQPASLKKGLSRTEFRFVQTRSGFIAASESGETTPTIVRLQLPSDHYWGGMGAGGALDVIRQLVEVLPEARLLVFIEERHLAGFAAAASEWKHASPERITAVVVDQPVSQWAQDNTKAGVCDGRPCVLVPRFASRAEDGPTFVPGDTFLADGIAAAGVSVNQSPLLFQGGNVMLITVPRTGERLLLIGEGEIDRHVSLGLTREQARDAYRIEFGADRCEVLPAVSFHLDYEVSIRATGQGLVALVPDEMAGAIIVMECAIDAAARGRLIPVGVAEAARGELRTGKPLAAVSVLGDLLASRSAQPGHVPESLAQFFQSGPTDSGVGNMQRIMAVMDYFAAVFSPPSAFPRERHARAYLQSLTRRQADRKLLHRQLVGMGLRLIKVPSFGEGRRALTGINGIQLRNGCLQPAYGGLFSPLDRAISAAVGSEMGLMGEVMCGETQRRAGALHCAVTVIGPGIGSR